MPGPGVDAVIFDWGGTLTRWHDVDFHAEALALAEAVVATGDRSERAAHAGRLRTAAETIWASARDHHRSATIADVFAEAGLEHDPALLGAYHAFWEPHTVTDPDVAPLWEALRCEGVRVGVLSNTLWSRERHRAIFARDGVEHLLDGDVYTSEIAWTKPHEQAFRAAMDAVGVIDPARCVYVGDRLFDDVWGAQSAGMRTIHIPHSTIPAQQLGPRQGVPDAVAQRLADILGIVRHWR